MNLEDLHPAAGATPAFSPAAKAEKAGERIYSNDEPSPLDPPMGEDRRMKQTSYASLEYAVKERGSIAVSLY